MYLLKVAENIQFLARQGISLCGDYDTAKDSNFMQLMHRHALDDPKLLDMLGKKTQIQNEIIKIMSLSILRILLHLFNMQNNLP